VKAIVMMFDSLNRHFLPPYGCDWTVMPNFRRLAQRTVTFDRSYICSMPCMPARRDFHTARPNFLHRSWGPMEPFDDSVPEILKSEGVYTHLVSDHYHYWEDGGCTYHNRYSTWQFERGQEGDPWIGQVSDPDFPPGIGRNAARDRMTRQDIINRALMDREELQPQARTFTAGLDFIRRNAAADQWLLHMETFDPHEPFFSHPRYKELYPHNYKGPRFDWPSYRDVEESHDQVEHCRFEYAALLSMCDRRLGDLLDLMDELDLWKDTMLILWTDHGFLLGEHEYWAKMRTPWYEELAHTPFFVWDPRCAKCGERRSSLVQPALDLGPTLLDFFDLPTTPDMLGQCLRETVRCDRPVREAAIFGLHGAQVNVTDGRYVYMRAAERDDVAVCEYTLMPTHMNHMFSVEELEDVELAGPFSFSKGCRVMRIGGSRPPRGRPSWLTEDTRRTLLYDLQSDPGQQRPMTDATVERRMADHLIRLMKECDAPPEQFARLCLSKED